MCRPLDVSRLPVGSSASTIGGLFARRPRQRDTLLLAAGQLRRVVMAAARETDFLEQRPGARWRIGDTPAISIGTETFS